MRSFLHLLTLVALLLAPLAAPAVAMAPAQSAAECQDMGMGMGMGSANHEMPADKHSGSATCCLAVCSAIAMPAGEIDRSEPVGHLAYQPLYESFRLGAGPSTDDPPPRHV